MNFQRLSDDDWNRLKADARRRANPPPYTPEAWDEETYPHDPHEGTLATFAALCAIVLACALFAWMIGTHT